MRLCDALAGHGESVTIVHPYTYMKDNIKSKDIPNYFGLEHKVKVKMLLTPLREHSGKILRFVALTTGFTISTLKNGIQNIFRRKQLVFISRDAKSLVPALLLRMILGPLCSWKVFFLAAEVKQSLIYKFVIRRSDGILAGVSTTREAIRKIIPLPEEKFLLSLAPVPVYKNDPDKTEARRRINYNSKDPLVVYTGKLGLDVKEVIYILKTAKLLPAYKFLFTGGRKSVVETIQNYCKQNGIENVILTGFFEDSRKIRDYQMAADILVSYYTSHDHMVEFNYPQKINEYMSTKNPIVTPDFPATRDVLNENNVFFVKSDDVNSLAQGISTLLNDKELSSRLANQAYHDVQELSFSRRAGEFIGFMKARMKD